MEVAEEAAWRPGSEVVVDGTSHGLDALVIGCSRNARKCIASRGCANRFRRVDGKVCTARMHPKT